MGPFFMKHPAYQLILKELFDNSPYDEIIPIAPGNNIEGWASTGPLFDTLVSENRPDLIIEVGSWKGASAINMAQLMRQEGIDGAVICIDTWLGSLVHRSNAKSRSSLHLKHGYPTIYFEFLSNVAAAGLTNYIVPIPQTSTNAYLWLKEKSIQAPLIYIDADHNSINIYSDISNYWELVSPGGALFGDDFVSAWPGVVRAVIMFAEKNQLQLQTYGEKWLLRKRAE